MAWLAPLRPASSLRPAWSEIAITRPPEAPRAFPRGFKDPWGELRNAGFAGWIELAANADGAISALLQGLRGPELQYSKNRKS